MPTKRQIQKWQTATTKLVAIIQELQQQNPHINVYLQEDTFNLMNGPSHDENHKPQFTNVIASVHAPGFGGGAW